nr:hypothetical protein [Tanacetum cinerariifolium]
MRMAYIGEDGHVLFTSHAWRKLFEILGSLVREFKLEFLSTCKMSDTKMGVDEGLHSAEEMAKDRFEAYWLGSTRAIPDKGDLRDYWTEVSSDKDFLGASLSYTYIKDHVRRLCRRLISCNISIRDQAPEKVAATDLFYLRSIDQGTANALSHLQQLSRLGLCPRGWLGLRRRFMGFERA